LNKRAILVMTWVATLLISTLLNIILRG